MLLQKLKAWMDHFLQLSFYSRSAFSAYSLASLGNAINDHDILKASVSSMIRSKHSWTYSTCVGVTFDHIQGVAFTDTCIFYFEDRHLLKFSSNLQFIGHNMVFLPVHYPCMQVLRLFFCPCDLYTCMHVFAHTWKISCHLYTLYW